MSNFPHLVTVMKTLDDNDGSVPELFIESAQKASSASRKWLRKRGLEPQKDYDIDVGTYWQGEQRGVKIDYRFADPGVAMLFKLTFAGI